MKRFNYKIPVFILMAIIITGSSSCKKILEQQPKNSTYDEVFWQSSRDALSAIAGNYSLLRDAVTDKSHRYYMYGDAIAQNYFTIQYTGDGLEGIQTGDFTFQYNVNSLANWTKYYKSIAMSNIVIDRIAKIPDENLSDVDNPVEFKNRIIGQAYFLRALSYFMMTRVWGDVPIVTEAYADPINASNIGRSPKTEVWQQIEDDCHSAAGLLSWGYTNPGDAKVTANRGSVYALLAHLYLWRGTMADATSTAVNLTDINSADTTISAVLNNGGYSLTDTANYINTFIGRSPEGIFEISMSENTMEGSNSSVGMEFIRSNRISYYSDNSRYYVPTGYINRHFLLAPPVLPHWFWDGTQWIWIPDESPATYDSTDVRYYKGFDYLKQDRPTSIKYSNVIFRNPGQKLDPFLSNNMIIFRLGDLMLLRAEIALYKNNPDAAIEIINFFRQRNGASPDKKLEYGMSKEDVMYEYMLERGKEMFLEGHIFYDLLRTRMSAEFIDWLPMDRFIREGFYWPVDPALFRLNPLLKQTTYWLGKV